MAISQGLLDQIFKINCGASGIKGTGTHNCPFNVKRTSVLIFTPAGFEYEEAFSLAYLQTLQQEGKAVVLAKVTAVEDLTAADNETTDTGSNIITVAGKSPRTFAFTFRNGLYFDKAIRTIESFGQYDVTYLDEALSFLYTASGEGLNTVVKGFTVGMLAVDPYKAGNGADNAFSRLRLQEIYRSEFDQDAAWTVSTEHNVRIASLDGVNDAIVTIEAIPEAGDTTVVFSVKTAADKKSIDLGGLVAADLQLTKDGVVVAFTGAPTQNTTTLQYTGTVAAAFVAGEVLTLRLNNATYTTGIIKKGNRLYKSNTATTTVVA